MKKKGLLKFAGILSTMTVLGGVLAGCGGGSGSDSGSALEDAAAELNYIVTHANTQTTLILMTIQVKLLHGLQTALSRLMIQHGL